VSTLDLVSFQAGGVAALEAFKEELLKERGHVENETEPVFDVIVDLLERVTEGLRQGVEVE